MDGTLNLLGDQERKVMVGGTTFGSEGYSARKGISNNNSITFFFGVTKNWVSENGGSVANSRYI